MQPTDPRTTNLQIGQKVRLIEHWPPGGEGQIYGRYGGEFYWPVLWSGAIGEILDKKINHDKCCYEYLVSWPGWQFPTAMLREQIESTESHG